MNTEITNTNLNGGFQNKRTDLIVFLTFAVLLVAAMSVHEPWFDEAESWLIARDNTLYEMIFVTPHYEGHPSLWWLLLAIPAKLGVPYEIGLKSVQLVFALFYAYLIVFCSPFPKPVKYLLPFTYFLFFQHGVMARPYSMMTVAMILSAITWEERNEKPARFCAALGFLCLTSAYGILIAGGIAVVWTIELLRDKKLFSNLTRILSMLGLLLLALFLLYTLLPRPDTYATNTFDPITHADFVRVLMYFIFFIPSETLVTTYASDGAIKNFAPGISEIIVMTVISLVFWLLIITAGKKKGCLLYFLVPYALLAFFGSAKYFWFHHIGVVFILILFYAWIVVSESATLSFSNITTLEKIRNGFVLLSLICGISWSVSNTVTDIKMPYSLGRELSSYIVENQLEGKNWITTWQRVKDKNTEEVISENTHEYSQIGVEVNAYLDFNLFGDNFGGKTYLDHRIPTKEEIDKDYELLKSKKIDYMISMLEKDVWDELDLGNDYRMDTVMTFDRIWKARHFIVDVFIIKNINQ